MSRAHVKTGLDILAEEDFKTIEGSRIGLVANQTSVTSGLHYSFELLKESKKVILTCIFSPEHGLYGVAQDMVTVKDRRLQIGRKARSLPVISLYGKDERSLKPSKRDLDSIDCLLFDIQDVGARYYTFISTMSYCMEACAEHGKRMIVLDRPNPINGISVEGPVLGKRYASFVGRFPIPVRHGMTSGELATLFKREYGIRCELDVIRMKGWKRDMWFDETELPWTAPSPNMPSLATATVYLGTCLLEGTNLSEGRGTTKPFEYVGAPWIDPGFFAAALNDEKLPGVTFRPILFSPKFHKWKDETCGGVHIFVTDRRIFKPFITGIAIVRTALAQHPKKFRWRREAYEFVRDRIAFDLLAGSDKLRKLLGSAARLKDIESSWKADLAEFKRVRSRYLLY